MVPRNAENLPISLFFRREKTSAFSAPITLAAFRSVSALMKKNKTEVVNMFFMQSPWLAIYFSRNRFVRYKLFLLYVFDHKAMEEAVEKRGDDDCDGHKENHA